MSAGSRELLLFARSGSEVSGSSLVVKSKPPGLTARAQAGDGGELGMTLSRVVEPRVPWEDAQEEFDDDNQAA
jgi:hypothetical protein